MNIRYIMDVVVVFIALVAGFVILGCRNSQAEPSESRPGPQTGGYSIDDFSGPTTSGWEMITDQVMGGVSTGNMAFVPGEGPSQVLHMTGKVSLDNNGGFIQVRKRLNEGKPFDARPYAGVELRVKGNGQPYAVHLRNSSTWLPWQFFEAKFTAHQSWQTLRVPWSEFKPHSLGAKLKVQTLKSVAVVAIGQAYEADLQLSVIGFYKEEPPMNINKLTEQEAWVIERKGTEPPFSGRYDKFFEPGFYNCRRCGARLFTSDAKFNSGCGWPSFDAAIEDAVKHTPDADGQRTEITCARCAAHLGHVFKGEGFTPRDTRYCVNSVSLQFTGQPAAKTGRALFASGCFWGTEYFLQKIPGVTSTTVGFCGGHTNQPTYKQVCAGDTGHAETVEVMYDPDRVRYETLARTFFETHDFTQLNRQGPDIGTQYRSAIFYLDQEQKDTAERLILWLKQNGHPVKTQLTAAGTFWPAEDYHQDYYQRKNGTPYCHTYRRVFPDDLKTTPDPNRTP